MRCRYEAKGADWKSVKELSDKKKRIPAKFLTLFLLFVCFDFPGLCRCSCCPKVDIYSGAHRGKKSVIDPSGK